MSRPAIVVESLSKRFRIGTGGGPGYHRLSEMLTGLPRYAYNQFFPRRSPEPTKPNFTLPLGESSVSEERAQPASDFWALRDVSFEVQPGEVVGIIGRNGAGKSTLLKILSRITEPTSGRFGVRGRVASLLEVGTGFHPELTGRENIYISGITLGMTRAEIKKRFDEIVDFSGVEKFLDTPVKHYSSGMQVRLGFAVAAHLESEILIIDEVLAVGDGDFQKKCLTKVQSVRTSGRAVLCVSHDLSMVSSLCQRAIILSQGKIAFQGLPSSAILCYRDPNTQGLSSCYEPSKIGKQVGDEKASLQKLWLENASGKICQTFDLRETIFICMEFTIRFRGNNFPYANFHVFDHRGEYVFVTACRLQSTEDTSMLPVSFVATCEIPGDFLNTGNYSIGGALAYTDKGTNVSFFERDALMFQVTEDLSLTLDSSRMGYAGPIPGVVRPALAWTVVRKEFN